MRLCTRLFKNTWVLKSFRIILQMFQQIYSGGTIYRKWSFFVRFLQLKNCLWCIFCRKIANLFCGFNWGSWEFKLVEIGISPVSESTTKQVLLIILRGRLSLHPFLLMKCFDLTFVRIRREDWRHRHVWWTQRQSKAGRRLVPNTE